MAKHKKYCSIIQCENNRGIRDDRICLFSSVQNRKKQWKEALNKLGLQHTGSESTMKVCMLHFHPDDIVVRSKKIHLRPGAAPSCRTRPLDPLWQKPNDKSLEIQQLNAVVQMESIDPLKCKPNDSFVESTTPSSRGNHNEYQSTVNQLTNQNSQVEQDPLSKSETLNKDVEYIDCDDTELQNPTTVTEISPTEYTDILRKCQRSEEENRKLRAELASLKLKSQQQSSEKLCEICLSSMTQQELSQHLCPNQVNIACEYCIDTTFTSILALRKHLSEADHTNLVHYKCKKCILAFPMRKLLEIHENTNQTHSVEISNGLEAHPMDKLFGCRICNFSTSTAQELKLHMKNCRSSQPNRFTFPKSTRPRETLSVQAPERSKKINSSESLVLLNTSKLSKPPKTPRVRKRRQQLQRFFECHICKCQLENRVAARKHSNQHLAARNNKCGFCHGNYTSNELMEWHICGTNDMEFQQISCEYCDQSFQSLVKCVEHLETAHADRTLYRCRKCTRIFGMMQLRGIHEKYFRHREIGSFQCELCSYICEQKSVLRRHITRAHAAKAAVDHKFLCTECGRSFLSRTAFKIHSLTHGEKTIQCSECPAKFHFKYDLKKHYEMHQNLKYTCNECNCTFKRTRKLENHIRQMHKKRSVTKNHECPFCDLKFAKRQKWENHLRSHTGERPFECEICHNFYRYKGDLMKHMQIHVGDNLYKCDVCGQGFRYHADLRRHSFKHYKEDEKKEKGTEAAQSSSDVVHVG